MATPTVVMQIRMPQALHEMLKAKAKEYDISLTRYVIDTLTGKK